METFFKVIGALGLLVFLIALGLSYVGLVIATGRPRVDGVVKWSDPLDITGARSYLRQAAVAGAIPGVITLFFGALALTGLNVFGVDWTSLIDGGLAILFVAGILLGSRVCAIGLAVLLSVGKVVFAVSSGTYWQQAIVLLLLAPFLYRGIAGSFAYQRLKASAKRIAIGTPEQTGADASGSDL